MFRAVEILISAAGDTGLIGRCPSCKLWFGLSPVVLADPTQHASCANCGLSDTVWPQVLRVVPGGRNRLGSRGRTSETGAER